MIIYVHFCKLSPTIFAGSIPIACCLTMQHLCFGWSKIHQAPAFPSSMMLVMDSAQASGSPSADKAGLCSFFTFPAMTSMNQSAGFLRLKGGEGFLVYPTVLNKKN